jgi:hypothetical protein
MKHFNCFFLFLVLSLNGLASMPSSPYHFYAPNFDNLLPFSHKELDTYKNLKIKEIEISKSEHEKTIFFFNSQGILYMDQSFYKNKEIGSTQYLFNKKGLPTYIESKEENGKFIFIDTIAYSENGIVTYYHSYEKVVKRNKVKSINTSWHLTLNSSSLKSVILIDTSYLERLFTVNNLNQVIKIQNTYRTDSIQTHVSGRDSIKIYWYKTNTDTVFNIGKQIHYTNGLIDTVKTYNEVYKGKLVTSTTIFEYNNNLLARIYKKNDYGGKSFYTYYNNGLLKNFPKEIVKLDQWNCEAIRFKYRFRRN